MEFLSNEKLTELAKGTEIELPGFTAGETISVRLRRPSLMLLAAEGKIPNALLASSKTFLKKAKKAPFTQRTGEIFRIVAMASLVSPSWEELQSAGLNLTDLQLLYIYNFSQTGVDTLRRFREKQRADKLPDHGESVSAEAQ